MRAIVPPPLAPGDRIGISAPGGPVRRDAFESGMAYLESRGFALVRGAHVVGRRAYLAGTDRERLEDLNRLIADPTIKAIWFARGGYGSARIVEDVDFDALRRSPKGLIGYSDVTVLQSAALAKARLASWHGPLVSELGEPATFDETTLWQALSGDVTSIVHPLPRASVVREGAGAGPLVGGCLSLLSSLVGTPFEAPVDGAILFWEEVNEPWFRIDRMLGHLRLSGRLAGLRGMIVGRLVGCGAGEPDGDLALREILERHLAGTRYPVVVDFPAGHCAGKTTLPMGRVVLLDTATGRLSFEDD